MSANRIKILLVDDHTVVRDGMRLMMSHAEDIEVAGEAETAQHALHLAREQHFDVVLVDINLPDKSGLDLLKSLRHEKPKMAVLIVSMYSEEVYAVRALKQGAAGYLTKNCNGATIVAAVRKAAAGGKYVSPAVMEKIAGLIGGEGMGSHEALSGRELEVLKQMASGESLVNIAAILHLSPSTVTTYRGRILEKMGMKNNAELTRYAYEHGLLN